jgi:hypothetical protein
MTSTDDILNQIDAALGDPFVSPDAMRCGPAQESAGCTPTVEIVDETTGVPYDGDRWAARQILRRRLVDNHGLTSWDALRAIRAVERGRETRHAHLVRAEAQAVIDEAMEPIRAAMRSAVAAVAPAIESFGRAMQQFAEAARTAAVSTPDDFALAPPQPTRPGDRPAWLSPYGPSARRRP